MSTHRISQLADRAGVPATTLRFYEQQGLLSAQRSPAGYRLYDDDAVHRLAFIAAGKHLGLPLKEIRDLLGVWEVGLCVQVQDQLRPHLRMGIAAAEQRVLELRAFVARLAHALKQLDAPARPGCCDPDCAFLLQHPTPAVSIDAAQVGPFGTERTPAAPPAPIACSLSAEGRVNQLARWRDLLTSVLHERSIDGGVRLTLPAERLPEAAALAAAEQACCPFFDFRLDLDRTLVHLEVRAPTEAAPLLTELLHPAQLPAR